MLSARTRPLSRGRAFRAGFRKPNARNGTQPEPRLRILLFLFKTRRSLVYEKVGKFRVLENSKLNLIMGFQKNQGLCACGVRSRPCEKLETFTM